MYTKNYFSNKYLKLYALDKTNSSLPKCKFNKSFEIVRSLLDLSVLYIFAVGIDVCISDF